MDTGCPAYIALAETVRGFTGSLCQTVNLETCYGFCLCCFTGQTVPDGYYTSHIECVLACLLQQTCWGYHPEFVVVLTSGLVVCHHDDGWERNVHMPMADLKKDGGISNALSGLQRVPLKPVEHIAVMLVITWDEPGCCLLYPLDGLCVHFGVSRVGKNWSPGNSRPGKSWYFPGWEIICFQSMWEIVGNNNFQNLYKHKELSMFPKVY